MGRPKLYYTTEEKREANRVKSKRHYDKAKKVIHARRSIKYRSTIHYQTYPLYNQGSGKTKELGGCPDREPVLSHNPDPLGMLCLQAEQVASKFANLMGKSPFNYVDTLYQLYLLNHNNNTFRDATIIVECLHKSIRRLQDEVLQLAGVGTQWKRCEKIGQSVSNVLRALEDILCYGMCGLEELVECHLRKELLYQTLPAA